MSFIYLPFFFVFFFFFEKLCFYVASKQENTYSMVSPNQSMLLANSYGNGVKLELKSKPITIKKKWRKSSVFTKKNHLKDDIKLNHSFPKNKMKKIVNERTIVVSRRFSRAVGQTTNFISLPTFLKKRNKCMRQPPNTT